MRGSHDRVLELRNDMRLYGGFSKVLINIITTCVHLLRSDSN